MGIKIRTIKEIRSFLSDQLKGIYPDPEIRALTNIIIKTVTGSVRLHYLALPEQIIPEIHTKRIIAITGELKKGKPIQYILGETSFYGCRLRLNNNTLIPRPETEELVDLVIRENHGFTGSIMDACTGSGCIAIALAVNLPACSVSGFDISEGAVEIAKENTILNKTKVSFFRADVFNFNYYATGKFDIIVSNPPYVREIEKKFMQKNVLDHEPHGALFVPDSDPLVFYRGILEIADKILHDGGKVYFEINEAFGKDMEELLESNNYSGISIVKDINSKDRIIKGIKNA
jgi:release factor glutamine methyltransferase